MRRVVLTLLLALPLLAGALPSSAQDAQYEIRDLIKAHDPEFETNGIGAYTITDDGIVAGFTGQSEIKSNPFVTIDGKPERLPTSTEFGATAADVNSAGTVVGRSRTAQPERGLFIGLPVMWVDGELIELELPLDSFGQTPINGVARSINEAGLIVGNLQFPGDENQPVVTWTDGIPSLLPYAFDYPYCEAYGLAESGLIAGECFDAASGAFLPVIWNGQTVTPMLSAPVAHTELWGITDTAAGGYVAVGFSYDSLEAPTAMTAVAITDGVAQALPTPDDAPICQAFSVSETAEGILIGGFCDPTFLDPAATTLSDSIAVAWLDGELIDVNQAIPQDKGWTLMVIRGVNSQGQMVGLGERNGERRSFILTPNTR